MHHYALALEEVETALERYGEDAWVRYYEGEAHRRMAEDPAGAAREQARRVGEAVDDERIGAFQDRVPRELESARAAYLRALELDPDLSLVHRGLGLTAYDRLDRSTARTELELYLNDSTRVPDRRFLERILKEVGNDLGPP